MQTLFIPMFGDFVEATRAETNRWFDLDHVPQRLSCPGFLRAERYELVAGAYAGPSELGPLRYLNVYYVAGPEVLQRDAYRKQVEARTPWTARRSGAGVKGTLLRGVWVQQPEIAGIRTARLGPSEGPRTWLVRLLQTADEDVLGMLSCPGVLGAEQYRSVKMDLPGPDPGGPPPYMTIYELETPEIVSTPVFLEHQVSAAWQGVYVQRPSPWTIRPLGAQR